MNEEVKPILKFLAIFVLIVLVIDAFRSFEFTKSIFGYRNFYCDETIYEREEGLYSVDDPSVRSSEMKKYIKCGYKDKKGNVIKADYIPLEKFERSDENSCYYFGPHQYCD